MQYTPHYNLNLPERTDIVNPLIQDNPNYSAIDAALYANKQRVVGTATHTKTGTNHSIVLADSDIPVFKFVATGDYASGDTFSVDGVTVTPRIASGASIPTGAFKINSTVEAILDGTILNLINVDGISAAGAVSYDNTSSGLTGTNVQDVIDELDSMFDNLGVSTGLNKNLVGNTGASNDITFDMSVYSDGFYVINAWNRAEYGFVSKRGTYIYSDSTTVNISGNNVTFGAGSYYSDVYLTKIV